MQWYKSSFSKPCFWTKYDFLEYLKKWQERFLLLLFNFSCVFFFSLFFSFSSFLICNFLMKIFFVFMNKKFKLFKKFIGSPTQRMYHETLKLCWILFQVFVNKCLWSIFLVLFWLWIIFRTTETPDLRDKK